MMVVSINRSGRTNLRLLSLLASAYFLAACDSGIITPGSPNLSDHEYVQLARLAAKRDAEAIDMLLSTEAVVENADLQLKWADRLAKLGDARGFAASSMARVQLASELELGDPERLLLMVEALDFRRRAAEIDPRIYGISESELISFENKIVSEENELARRYGPLQLPQGYEPGSDKRILDEAKMIP